MGIHKPWALARPCNRQTRAGFTFTVKVLERVQLKMYTSQPKLSFSFKIIFHAEIIHVQER